METRLFILQTKFHASNFRKDFTLYDVDNYKVIIYIYIYRVSQEERLNFGRVFLRSNYTDITQNTYIQSSMFTEILAREMWTTLVSAYCTLSVTLYSSYFICIPTLSLQRPWLCIRFLQCIVVGSQWTIMSRVRVFL
jgi:hypothetical protein